MAVFDKKEEAVTVNGVIETVVYKNDSNDYTVIEVVDSENNLITAVGTMPFATEGESVVLSGKWVYHKEFGRQLEFENYEKKLPEEIDGIIQYLSSKAVKGIGPITALKIVNKFGVDTFDVMENHPEWLSDIPGITMKKAAAIAESFKDQSGMRNVMMFCRNYMDKGEINSVYKHLGAGAIGIIKENPYILCGEDYEISFEKADKIGRDFGIAPDAKNRIFAGLEYVLSYNSTANGHTCLPEHKLIAAACEVLSLDEKTVTESLISFYNDGDISRCIDEGITFAMKSSVAEAETYIASRIAEMDRYINRFSATDIYMMIEKVETLFNINYAIEQKEAIFKAVEGSFMILTGGPGTGKTTVVRALLSIFNSLGLKCVLAAPTGRATKRLSEATGEEAKTIHRMLEMERNPEFGVRFNRDSKNPINENVIIVDEASMIDLSLMYALFKALRKGSRLILIGDSDQLPSVGAGNVLADFLDCERITKISLTEIFRQTGESLIISNAHRINRGENPILNDTTKDFFFVRRENEQEIPSTIASLITDRLPKTYGRQIQQDIQVITPSRKGCGGVSVLNPELQMKINPPSKFKNEVNFGGLLIREGDKVMQTANNYDIEWKKNGDVGVVERIRTREEEIDVRFDDKTVTYSYEMARDELELAYAITVHKSQGSEYPTIIIPACSCPQMLLNRNLLYTAVTRAKNMVIIVGRSSIVYAMVKNNREVLRYTTLKKRLRET